MIVATNKNLNNFCGVRGGLKFFLNGREIVRLFNGREIVRLFKSGLFFFS